MTRLEKKAKHLRRLVINVAYKNQSGHIGSCLSCIEIMTYLFYNRLNVKRDIFILSKGHAALTYYAILYDLELISEDDLYDYSRRLGDHVHYDPDKYIWASTGSLGHGVGIALGYALANPHINVYCLCGDAESQSGIYMEAIELYTILGLQNLHIIVDSNGYGGYGPVFKYDDEIYPNGHDFKQIEAAFNRHEQLDPNVLVFETIKGKGVKRFENEIGSHYWRLTEADYNNYLKFEKTDAK